MVTGNTVYFWVSVALHVNWAALADIHLMLPGRHGHKYERGSIISQWEMGWDGKDWVGFFLDCQALSLKTGLEWSGILTP